MSTSTTWLRWVSSALSALLLTFALPGDTRAAEQRCTELGGACRCSEPFDTSNYAEHPGLPGMFDPGDSSTKECTSGNLSTGYALWLPGGPTPVNETGMPSGNAVSRVMRTTTNGTHYLSGYTAQSSTKRLCTRAYYKLDGNFEGGGPTCQGNKLMEFSWGPGGGNIQMGQKASGTVYDIRVTGFGSSTFNLSKSGNVTLDDCRGEWCIVEMCVGGNTQSGKGIVADGYIRRVNNGETMTYGPVPLADNNGGNMRDVALLNLWRSGAGDCSGGRELSHAMQAEWTTDTGQYIGAAYEIEGGTGGPPPPPDPPPDPPPPPPPPTGGDPDFNVSHQANGTTITVTSSISDATGPFQFLFDCGNDGFWNGVVNTGQAVAQYPCTFPGNGTYNIRAWAWDQGSSTVFDEMLQVTVGQGGGELSAPGRPVLVQ